MKSMAHIKLLLAALTIVGGSAMTLSAQTQHGWRGPLRDGIYPDKGLLKVWPEAGPQLLWETVEIGKGYSSPTIVGNRLYITGMNEDETQETFSAFTTDGKLLYTVAYGTPWKESYPETRTTPTIVGDKAYVTTGNGTVVCLNTADGSTVWKVDGVAVFGRKTGRWGISEGPLVFDNKVIFCPGGDMTTVVALDAATGKTVWKSPTRHEPTNYTSPLLINHNGKKQIVTITGKAVIGVNVDTGAIEWAFDNWGRPTEGQMSEKISPNTPIYHNGCIFFSEGYDMGSHLLQLNNDGTAVTAKWSNPDLDTHVGGYVLVDGVFYGSGWKGNNAGNWMAVDEKTGKSLYDTAWTGKSKGAIIYADGMLYLYEERRGTVALVRATPEKLDVISEFRITKGEGPHWAHPVIDNGVLYVRHGSFMGAYKIK
ncbi:MAG: PQQ-binding-like beta-propeller repeat protein [Prevotellaceae bacterium]|jgi:outer membrane protein assembly factor BamB|nr:PQQ-binding-like beta-propeller repeat protein [Prevotellaceae bacterium]